MIPFIIAGMILITILFAVASQYLIGSIWLIIGYAVSMLVGSILCVISIKIKHEKETRRLMDFFDDVTRIHNLSEDGLSALEHKIYTLVQSNSRISEQITRERDQINSIISDVAHQSKTPLSNIIMYSDFLFEQDELDLAYVHKIQGQAQKLKFLFEALIKMSRCESGIVVRNLNCNIHNIKDLIARGVSDIYLSADAKNITIYTDCPSNITGYFDLKWTREALFNILDNGVKYSPNGSNIYISVKQYELFVCIEIKDQGMGISEEELPNIWKRFYRGKEVTEEEGVGIGLYLTKQILYSEHGYIKVKSESGKGSIFSIYLPIQNTIKSDETVRFEKQS